MNYINYSHDGPQHKFRDAVQKHYSTLRILYDHAAFTCAGPFEQDIANWFQASLSAG